jgi:azurin
MKPFAATWLAILSVVAIHLAACSKPVEISIATLGNKMAYDTTQLTVRSGQTVHLTLRNAATDAAMSHNWVLAKPGTEASVAEEGQKAGESVGFLPMIADVIAHTAQVKPGQSGDVTFTAPEPGNYPYLCTNPGHAQTMKGTLRVTP